MHDIDQTQLEAGEFEEEEGELEFEEELELEGESLTGSTFTESEEMELAAELLDIQDDAELELFFGKLMKRTGRRLRKFARSSAGRALVGILKRATKKALPIAGGALGTLIGGPAGGALGSRLASLGGKALGLELEGMSPEDQEFEVARRVVRMAGDAAKSVISASPAVPSATAAKSAVVAAAKRHLPVLVRGAAGAVSTVAGQAGCSGRWVRRGRRIIVFGVY